MELCSVDGCLKEVRCISLCESHYRRFRRHGNPEGGSTAHGQANQYYKTIVMNYKGDDCLIWPYSRDTSGYGVIFLRNKKGAVSRFLCQDVNGSPPTKDHQAAHSCGRGHLGCVNPMHLSWKTRKENKADELIHGTRNRGERSGSVKLTENKVLEIKSLRELFSKSDLAKKYSVSVRTIRSIFTGEKWGWLNSEKDKMNA